MDMRVRQQGGVGIPVVLAIVGGVVVLYIGYSFVSGFGPQDVPDAPANTYQAPAAATNEPAHAQSYVSFDDNFYQAGGDFYIRVGAGVDENGNTTYTYVKADIADVKTFHRVPVLGGIDTPKRAGHEGSGGGTVPAFYMDSQHVYFFTGTSIEVLTAADPASFQVLSPVYAKDNNNVYFVNTTCDATGNCTGTVTVIPGAHPDSFQTFHDTTVPDPNGTGTVTIDAKDDTNIYYYGTWIGPLPDPDDYTVHPQNDHPVLISP